MAELGLVAIAQIMDDYGPARRERSHSPEHQVAPPKVQALLMQKRVDTECKTADQSRHQEQGSAAAQTRCRAGEQLMEMLHASSPASTPTGVPHQGGEYHSKVPAAEEAEQAAADVAAEVATVALPPRAFQPRVAARAGTSASSRLLGGAGLGGWDGLSSLEHLSH